LQRKTARRGGLYLSISTMRLLLGGSKQAHLDQECNYNRLLPFVLTDNVSGWVGDLLPSIMLRELLSDGVTSTKDRVLAEHIHHYRKHREPRGGDPSAGGLRCTVRGREAHSCRRVCLKSHSV